MQTGAMCAGFGEYDLLYTDDDGLHGFTLANGTSVTLVLWRDIGLRGAFIPSISALPDGSIYCVSDGNLILLRVEEIAEDTRTEIILGAMTIGEKMDAAVLKFNNENERYRVTVRDYEPADTMSITRLNLDITSENAPDIFEITYLPRPIPFKSYFDKGLVLDLYPLLDADPTLSRDSFLDGVLRNLEIDGQLASIASGFSVYTLSVRPSAVGDKTGWTMEEFVDFLSSLPPGASAFEYRAAHEAREEIIKYSLNSFVDRESGTVHFDDAGFVALLEYFASHTQQLDRNEHDAGREVVLNYGWYTDFLAYANERATYGEPFRIMGYPTNSGTGLTLVFNRNYAISNRSKCVEGAWEFISYLMSYDFLWGDGAYREVSEGYEIAVSPFFTTNKAATEALITHSMTTERDNPDYPLVRLWLPDLPATREEMEYLLNVVANANSYDEHSDAIWRIVTEELQGLFAGDISAEQTARVIQSRASLYLAEQR